MTHSCVVRYQEHTDVDASFALWPFRNQPGHFKICWSGRRLTSSCWQLTQSPRPFPSRKPTDSVCRCVAPHLQTESVGFLLQMRRAAVSIPANIAEGFRRRGKADKARFMNMAEGSVEECRYYLILARDLAYADTQGLTASLEEVSRLLSAYTTAILSSASRLP